MSNERRDEFIKTLKSEEGQKSEDGQKSDRPEETGVTSQTKWRDYEHDEMRNTRYDNGNRGNNYYGLKNNNQSR